MKIEIKSEAINVRTGKNDDGGTWERKEQEAFFHRGDGCVFPVKLQLQGDAYKLGVYDISQDSFVPGKYGRIEFFPRPDLGRKPVAVPAAKAS